MQFFDNFNGKILPFFQKIEFYQIFYENVGKKLEMCMPMGFEQISKI